jgi:hypothetical protein
MSETTMDVLRRIEAAVLRIEASQQAMVDALNEEADDEPQRTLEGEDAGQERDQSRSLDE